MRGNADVQHIAVTKTRDSYGDTTTTEAAPAPVASAVFAPRSSTERTTPNAPAVITGGTLYLTGVTVGPNDRFTVNGDLYEVEGDPGRWVSPFTGRDFGVEVAVKRWAQP